MSSDSIGSMDATQSKRSLENGVDSLNGLSKKLKTVGKEKKKVNGKGKATGPVFDDGYEQLSLEQIKEAIVALCKRVPTIPPGGINVEEKILIRDWAESMQAVIEEFNLVLSCVSPAIYRWGSDRSGAADQSLTLLSNEINLAQEQVSASCSTRLTNVLAPVVDLVVSKVIKTVNKETGEEVKEQIFSREVVDPEFHQLCSKILCRNAKMLRQVVLGNFHKIVKVIEDYQKAAKKDNQQDRSLSY